MSPASRVPPGREALRLPRPRPSQTTAVVLSVLAAVALAASVAVAALAAVPPSLVNLSSSASDGATAYVLELDGVAASVVVPESWIVRRVDDATIAVDTPDGGMSASVELIGEAPQEAVGEHPDLSTIVRSEVLESGREVVHADAADGRVVASVGVLGGALRPSVLVVAAADPPATMPTYRPALAELLEGVGG